MHKSHADRWGTTMHLQLTPPLDMVNTIPRNRMLGSTVYSAQGLRRHCTIACTQVGVTTVATFLDLLPSHVQVSSAHNILYFILHVHAYIYTHTYNLMPTTTYIYNFIINVDEQGGYWSRVQ